MVTYISTHRNQRTFHKKKNEYCFRRKKLIDIQYEIHRQFIWTVYELYILSPSIPIKHLNWNIEIKFFKYCFQTFHVVNESINYFISKVNWLWSDRMCGCEYSISYMNLWNKFPLELFQVGESKEMPQGWSPLTNTVTIKRRKIRNNAKSPLQMFSKRWSYI